MSMRATATGLSEPRTECSASPARRREPITAIQADLTALQASYRALNIDEQIKNNRSDLVLTDKNLLEITKIIEKMRKDIVD